MNVIIIPSLNPNKELLDYVEQLEEKGFQDIIIINDGSSDKHQWIFDELEKKCIVLTHAVNMGKGRSLKNSFNYVLNQYGNREDFTGIITADSDGQHTVPDVVKIDQQLSAGEEAIYLGSRNFHQDDVPFKSKFGNILTSKLFTLLYGVHVEDTQTGLRGISKNIIQRYLVLPGERFEYEMNMLIDAAIHKVPMKEIEIKTVYENNNSETHFDPIRDSFKIYRLIFANFFKFILSSLSSCLIDLALFQLFIWLIDGRGGLQYEIIYATVLARIISSLYNYTINKNIVFKSDANHKSTLIKYYILCVIQMACSAGLTYAIAKFLPIPRVGVKAVVDTVLFFISYRIQKAVVFGGKRNG